jgi:hypothetical protein
MERIVQKRVSMFGCLVLGYQTWSHGGMVVVTTCNGFRLSLPPRSPEHAYRRFPSDLFILFMSPLFPLCHCAACILTYILSLDVPSPHKADTRKLASCTWTSAKDIDLADRLCAARLFGVREYPRLQVADEARWLNSGLDHSDARHKSR